ncbi:MAG: transferrin-binding protein-like solute binding protein, partial [Zavarzinia sp.]|nr:transferrin-binding protein-like solute binding protein [Zavarzinia sp.]
AEMARLDSSGGVELTLLDGGGGKSVVGQLAGWVDFGFILPGLVAALDESASLSVPGYTSLGETDVLMMDGTATVDLTYTGFAYWLVDDFDPTDDTRYQFVIAGGGAFSTSPAPNLTTIASLPTTAVYTGKTFGLAAFNGGADGYAPFGGDATLTADFGAGTVDAAFTDLMIHTDETTAYLMGDVTFTGATIDAASASVSGGTAMTYVDDMNPGGVTPDGGAALEAGFYGPAAEEMAGTWHVSGTNLVQPDPGETAPMIDISGAFGAAR